MGWGDRSATASDCARNKFFLDKGLPFVVKDSDSVVFCGYKLFHEGFLTQLQFIEVEI